MTTEHCLSCQFVGDLTTAGHAVLHFQTDLQHLHKQHTAARGGTLRINTMGQSIPVTWKTLWHEAEEATAELITWASQQPANAPYQRLRLPEQTVGRQ